MRWMVVAMLALMMGCEQPAETAPAAETSPAAAIMPPGHFLDTNGNAWSYDELQGSWLVVNYWATWCAPCIKEIPELIALDENHEDIHVFGVNFDAPPPQEMAAQIAKMKITFPVYAEDPSPYLGIDLPQVLPTTVIVDPSGNVRQVLVGPQDEYSLLEVIRG